jgi:TldD protein
MKDLAENTISLAKMKNVDYADLRVVRRRWEEILVKNGNIEALTQDEDFGFGIRVLFRGAWGFACSSRVNKKELEKTFDRAWKISRESAKIPGKKPFFPPAPPVVARYQTPLSINPFQVSMEGKLECLLEAERAMRQNRRVNISEAFMGAYLTEKTFASTEGSFIEQEIVECGAGISATAIEGGEIQVRSYPNSFRGNFATRGYEWVEDRGPFREGRRGSGPAPIRQTLSLGDYHPDPGWLAIGPPGP